MNIKSKIYTRPSLHVFNVEMEEGIAAGSGEATPGATPVIEEEEGDGGTIWDTDGF